MGKMCEWEKFDETTATKPTSERERESQSERVHLKKSAWKSSRVAKQTLLNIVTILSKRRVWNKSCCRFLFSCLSVLFLILLLYPYFSTRFSTMTMILWCVCDCVSKRANFTLLLVILFSSVSFERLFPILHTICRFNI